MKVRLLEAGFVAGVPGGGALGGKVVLEEVKLGCFCTAVGLSWPKD